MLPAHSLSNDDNYDDNYNDNYDENYDNYDANDEISDLDNVAGALPLPVLALKLQLPVFVLRCLRKSRKISENL